MSAPSGRIDRDDTARTGRTSTGASPAGRAAVHADGAARSAATVPTSDRRSAARSAAAVPAGRGRGWGRGPEDEGPQDGTRAAQVPGEDPGPHDGGPFPGPWGPGGPRGRRGGPGGRGRGRGPGGRGGPGRRPRGDVRLAILALLREEPRHGYQIIQEISERSGGSWKPSPGSVYPTVAQLADEGLVHTEKESGRTVVHLTEAGRTWAEEHAAELDAVWSQVEAGADDGFADLRTAGRGLAGAVAQIAQVGTADADPAGDGRPRRGPTPALPAARRGRSHLRGDRR